MFVTHEWIALPSANGRIDRNGSQFQKIMDFLKKEVERYSRNVGDKFSVTDMFGGDKFDWCKLGYPIGWFYTVMLEIYEKEGRDDPSAEAIATAGRYVGMCVKYILRKDPNKTFKVHKRFISNLYERVK